MSTTSAIDAQLTAIQEGLSSRSGLTGVKVFSATVGIEEAGLECIALGFATLQEIAFAMGGDREETWTITGSEIRVVSATWQGDTEATIQAARSRAVALLADIEEYLAETYTGDFPDVELTGAELSQNFTADGRECRITFELTLTGIKNP